MKNQKKSKKNFIRSLIFLSAFIFILLINSFCIIAEEPIQNSSVEIPINDNVILEFEKILVTNHSKLQAPQESQITIKYPKNEITILPPKGSTIESLSNDSINVQYNDDVHGINFTESLSLFSKMNYYSSIDGLDDFNVKITHTDNEDIYNMSENITQYTINWGNNQITNGTGMPSKTISHTYKKEGTYLITIQLTDKNRITYIYQRNQTFKLTTEKYVQLWANENKETIAVSTAGTISGITFLGIILTETGKYKFLALLTFLIPLYTHIQKEDILDQFVRGKIYGYIKGNPGVHYNQIIRDLDVKNGTLSYHVHILEKMGIIKSRKEGLRYRAFYPTNMNFPEQERNRFTDLQIKILKKIRENRGVNQKEIAKTLNEKHQTISYNIRVLQKAGLVDLFKKGRSTKCYINKTPILTTD